MEKLALGAVQLGIPYGAANETGMPTVDEAVEIVRVAVDRAVPFIDTAHIYGESEERIGEAFAALRTPFADRPTVVTKLGMVDMVDPTMCPDATTAMKMVEAIVATSQERLRTETLDVVLLHNFAGHSKLFDGAPWRRLVQMRDVDGIVERVGVSCYTPEEAMEALQDPDMQHIQLPFNLLDSRFKVPDFLAAAAARPDVTVHTRSCFLQGLLVSGVERWPPFAHARIAPALVFALEQLAKDLGRQSRIDLCLAYSRGVPWITQVLVGSETAAQLQETISLFQSTAPLTSAELSIVDKKLSELENDGLIPPRLLNPGAWIPAEEIPEGHDMAQGLYRGPGSKLVLKSAKL